MMDIDISRTIVGIIGNMISFGLFVSPIPTFVKIIKQKSVAEFKPDPYLVTLLNCAFWSFYGLPLVHPDSLLVVTINGTGVATTNIFIAIFFAFSPWKKRRYIIIALLVEAVFFAGAVYITLNFFHDTEGRSNLIGTLCIIVNAMMYASPLTVMKMVIQTKSVKYMPVYLLLAQLCCGIDWFIYGLLGFDFYILLPNGLGTISAVVQLILYATYYKTTNWEEDDENPKSNIVQIDNV